MISNPTLAIDFTSDREVRRGFVTAAYFASFVALGLTTGSLGPTLPALASQTKVGLGAISYLFMVRSLGYVLGSLRSGRLFDSKPAHVVLGTMLLVMSLVMALVPFAGWLPVLLALMMLLGAAESGVDVGSNALLVRLHGTRVGPLMTAMHSFFGVGALVAPLVVAQTTLFGHASVNSYFVLAVLLVPIGAFTIRLPNQVYESPTKRAKHGIKDRRFVFLVALFLFLYVGAEVGFAGWIFTYAIEQKLTAAVTAAYLTSLFWGSLTAGRVLMIPITARVNPVPVLILSLLGSIVSLGLLVIAPFSTVVVFIGTIGAGVSMAAIFPTALSFASRRVEITGQVTGWFVVGASSGSTLIPLLIGQSFQVAGPRSLVFVAELALLLATGVLMVAIRRSRTERPAS
jgi:FHS family Na+ dependent glucose MFS transporter 1